MYKIDIVVRSAQHADGIEYHYSQSTFRDATTATRIALEDAAARIDRVAGVSVRIIEEATP